MTSPLEHTVRFFTEETRILSCISVVCGAPGRRASALGGTIDPAGNPVTGDTIFDLASLTKLFTSLTLMRLADLGEIRLDRAAAFYEPRFTGLGGATVDQVLGYEINLQTPERIDAQPDAESGLRQLFLAQASPQTGRRFYSDIHALVIGRVIEAATGLGLEEAVRSLVLDPLGMTSTWARVPEALRPRCISCEREHRIIRDSWLLYEGPAKGVPHDPKARLLAPLGLTGHAGLFATIGDVEKLALGILERRIVPEEDLRRMARNRLGRPLPDGTHTQYLGSLCYVKHPVQYYSEVPAHMGARTLALSGFAGHHLSVDPEHGLYTVCLGNRVLNRLTMLVPEEGRTRTDYGLMEDGRGSVRWPDGETVFSSVDYVHQKDEHLHRPAAEALGLAEGGAAS